MIKITDKSKLFVWGNSYGIHSGGAEVLNMFCSKMKSLGANVVSLEDAKRGKKNAVQRKDASKESYSNGELDFYEDLEFEPFDDKKIVNY